MKLLIDTHVFLWLRNAPDKIPVDIIQAYQDINNEVFLSLASVWEMQIKHQLNKLKLDLSLDHLIKQQQLENNLQLLPIDVEHIYALSHLPFHHNDPFDRLIISQSQCEDMSLISADKVFHHYDVNLMWLKQ